MIETKATADGTDVYLYGAVGYDWEGFTDKDVVRVLNEADTESPLNVRINSEGGSVFDGYAIYSLLRTDPRPVNVMIDGIAASIASVIALAGDTVKAASESMFMIHEPFAMAVGDWQEMERMAASLKAVRRQLANVYDRHGEGSYDEYLNLMANETWFTAEEAAEQGFVGEVVDVPATINDYVLTGFKNVPPKLRMHRAATPNRMKQAINVRLKSIQMDDLLTAGT